MVEQRFFGDRLQKVFKFLEGFRNGNLPAFLVAVYEIAKSKVMRDKTPEINQQCFRVLVDEGGFQFIGLLGVVFIRRL